MPPTQRASLYQKLMKAAKALPQYNYRCYFEDKVKSMFPRKQAHMSSELDAPFVERCNALLATLKRQALIQKSYEPESLVIERKQ